jgi:hypothetical protein
MIPLPVSTQVSLLGPIMMPLRRSSSHGSYGSGASGGYAYTGGGTTWGCVAAVCLAGGNSHPPRQLTLDVMLGTPYQHKQHERQYE